MQESPDLLADRWHVVVLLRLLVAAPQDVIYGEVVEIATERRRRFRGWQGLHAALEATVRSAVRDRDDRRAHDSEGEDLG